MNIIVFSKVLLVMIVHSCLSAIIVPTPKAQHLTRIYEAGIDILMTCYGEQPRTVGIAGNSDGSFLQALRSKYLIPVVLTGITKSNFRNVKVSVPHRLEFFVIASDTVRTLHALIRTIWNTIYMNPYANFIILDTSTAAERQCSEISQHTYLTNIRFNMINSKFICLHREVGMIIADVNPFAPHAPKTWKFARSFSDYYVGQKRPFYLFLRSYKKGGRNCEDLNFSKTTDLGGYPVAFIMRDRDIRVLRANKSDDMIQNMSPREFIMSTAYNDYRWFIDNVIIALNATPILSSDRGVNYYGIDVSPFSFIDPVILSEQNFASFIFSQTQFQVFALSQHTTHKSQLEKILTVIDKESRIGTGIVYLVTFLFLRFFLRQASVPAILELVRLTCNTGLAKLPKNVAPTVYLACLFAFVVTLQGIFTGNLASLLTSTIAHPNVNEKQDIATLGYTAYTYDYIYNKLAGDPMLHDRVRLVPRSDGKDECIERVLSDPLSTCVLESLAAASVAANHNLHIARDPILSSYTFYYIGLGNPIAHRLEGLMLLWSENGLRRQDERVNRLMLQFVDDDEVKKNVERRVMNLNDLAFAFVILGIGLAFSLICFISELVVFRVRLKMAKRRDRARTRLAWGDTEKNCFSSLKYRCNPRRLFSKRR